MKIHDATHKGDASASNLDGCGPCICPISDPCRCCPASDQPQFGDHAPVMIILISELSPPHSSVDSILDLCWKSCPAGGAWPFIATLPRQPSVGPASTESSDYSVIGRIVYESSPALTNIYKACFKVGSGHHSKL